MSCSAETASRMKSKLPACFFISSALREMTISSAPRRRASSFLLGDVVNATMRFQRMGNLDGHVAESAETDNTDFLALCDTPAAHGRVCGDPSAQERRSPGEIEVGRDAQNETLVDDDAVGIASVGDATEILVRGVEG